MANIDTSKKILGMDIKALLSTMWIFLSVNYICCDVISNMKSDTLQGYLAGNIGSISVTQEFLLLAGILLEIPFIMIVLSRVLKYRVNRWTNTIVGILLVIIQLGSFSTGTPPTLHYMAFSAIEVVGCSFVIGLAWRWRNT